MPETLVGNVQQLGPWLAILRRLRALHKLDSALETPLPTTFKSWMRPETHQMHGGGDECAPLTSVGDHRLWALPDACARPAVEANVMYINNWSASLPIVSSSFMWKASLQEWELAGGGSGKVGVFAVVDFSEQIPLKLKKSCRVQYLWLASLPLWKKHFLGGGCWWQEATPKELLRNQEWFAELATQWLWGSFSIHLLLMMLEEP